MELSTCLAPCAVPCGKVCAAPCERPLSANVCRSTLCGALLQGCAAPIVAAQGCGRLLTHCRCTGHPTDRSQAATPGGSKADYRACHVLFSAQGESQGAPKGILSGKNEQYNGQGAAQGAAQGASQGASLPVYDLLSKPLYKPS